MAAVVLLGGAIAMERWYASIHVERQRSQLRVQAHLYLEALKGALNRRMAALPALRAFLEAGPPGPDIRLDLDAFADGLHASVSGVRGLQYVRGGVVRYTSNFEDNRAVFGYNLLADPRPEIREGVMQALATDTVVLSGPHDLLQGGVGLIGRLAVFPKADPRFGLVAVVMDLHTIFAEAGLADTTAPTLRAVRDASGLVLEGSSEVFTRLPVILSMDVTGGEPWELAAVPLRGWASAGPAFWGVRVSLLLIVVLGTALAWAVSSRQMRLRRAVSTRTRALSDTNARLEAKVQEVEVAEIALRGQHTLLRAVIDGSPDPILVRDRTGQYVLINDAAARVFGRPTEKMVGRTPAELFPPDYATDVEAADRVVRASGTPMTRERRIETPTGDRTYLIAVHPWLDAPDESAGTVTVARDVTDRLLLESQLRHAQKLDALGRLSGGIAHDFNNILTAILANTHLIAQGLGRKAPELTGEADEIRAAAQRGAELTRKLLAFGRRDMLERHPLDLVEVVADTAAMARRLLPEHIEVRPALPAVPVIVNADHGALSQILLNLVTNARDAMPTPGRLEMSLQTVTTSDGDAARLVVRDTGVGMNEATRAHIFEPFFTTKPPGAGTGLGLSIAYGLIQQHDGTIRLESHPGRGTTVTIDLPIVTDEPEEPAPARRPSAGGRAETVLVVEDEDAIRTTMRRVLTSHGYRVLTARDGLEGLEVLRQESGIALVITDLVMPRMGGAELSQLARGAGVLTPFLFTTGYPGVAGAQGGEAVDGALLPKPWEPEELLAKVREMLDATPETVR
jgi:PAS domain S-box-containing protein